MTEQNSKKYLKATEEEIRNAYIAGLKYTLGEMRADFEKPYFQKDTTRLHYLRQQIDTTEVLIYALENDRIARSDAELREFQKDV